MRPQLIPGSGGNILRGRLVWRAVWAWVCAAAIGGSCGTHQARAERIAGDDFEQSLRLLDFQQLPSAGVLTSADDAFGVHQVDVTEVPSQFVDRSVTGSDRLGIIDPDVKRDRWFGISDLRNPDNETGSGTVTWQFETRGFEQIMLSVDIAAMGDFETTDSFHWSSSWDGVNYEELLISSVDVEGTWNYELADGSTVTLDDPLVYGTRPVDNRWATFEAPITGAGDRLWVRLTATADGGTEVYGFDNLWLDGEAVGDPGFRCDLNGDLTVDASDVGIMFANWEGSGTGDFTRDGVVDAADVATCFAEWTGDQNSSNSVTAIPEPVGGAWSLLLLLSAGRRMRVS